jgi:hypothetical protein
MNSLESVRWRWRRERLKRRRRGEQEIIYANPRGETGMLIQLEKRVVNAHSSVMSTRAAKKARATRKRRRKTITSQRRRSSKSRRSSRYQTRRFVRSWR